MNTPEKDTQKKILQYLGLLGIMAWRNNTGRHGRVSYGKVGSSDIIGILQPSGRFLAIEVKGPGDKPTLQQIAFLEAIRSAGGVGILAYSLDDVREALTGARPGGAR